MTTLQLLFICVTALGLAKIAAGAVVQGRADRLSTEEAPLRTNHRVTVHTKKPDDQTIHGVLVGDYSDRLVLISAEYVTPTGPQPMPGVQHIATRDIAWVDVFEITTSLRDRPIELGAEN